MSTTYAPQFTGDGIKARVQKLGGYLAGMVMPNIAAFIAWGLISALFTPTGWIPNEKFAALVSPMILIVLPVLVGCTGGRLVHGQRGAVVGAVAAIGVAAGSHIPMFLGAMTVGPLAGYLLKKIDELTEERTKPGFEMLVENFTAGIVGTGMAVAGVWGIGPVMRTVTERAGDGVEWLVNNHLLPFASVLIEPAKVLFLNNAVNHGVLVPLGFAEAARHGKSILFLLESNPGPGLGVLLAYLFFGPKTLRPSVPAAIVIQFLGGIHEIYFPYILMKPRLILAAIAGSAAGILVFIVTGAGLVSLASPGSVFAYAAETPKGDWFGVLAGVIVSAGVSFAVGAVLLGFGRSAEPPNAESGADPAAAHADAVPIPADADSQHAPSLATDRSERA
jgi:PTS system mannitol-specific IIC component